MRVLHITRTTLADTVGGLEHHIAYLTDALRGRGHDVSIVRTAGLREAATPAGSRIVMSGEIRSSQWAEFIDTLANFFFRISQNWEAHGIAKSVDEASPDIIHQHTYLGGIAASWLLSRKYPVVFTNHTGAYLYLNRFFATRLLQRQIIKIYAQVIAPSRELLPEAPNAHYIPNGVDLSIFHPRPDHEIFKLKEKWNCAGKFICICPRRWAPTKGIIYLARAIHLLPPEVRRSCVFIFAGNRTAGYERYQRKVNGVLLSLPEADIRILGNLEHPSLSELLAASDLCIIPSLVEATSLACLEAMACGTPVLATRTGGLTELIRDGENGWLVPCKDPRAIATQFRNVISNPDERQEVRAAALRLIQEDYTWDIAAARTEAIYQQVILNWRQRQNASRGSR